jgi:hypothetical protein
MVTIEVLSNPLLSGPSGLLGGRVLVGPDPLTIGPHDLQRKPAQPKRPYLEEPMAEAVDPVHGGEAQRFGGWHWDEPRHGEHFQRCSYCGSIRPEDLAAEPAWKANWADRKYGFPHKFYVNIPNRTPDRLFTMGSYHGAEKPTGHMDWIAWADLTAEQHAIRERDGMRHDDRHPDPQWVYFGTRAHHSGKFYTVHLADPTVGADVKDAIEQRSGLRFTFAEGRVAWEAVQLAEW